MKYKVEVIVERKNGVANPEANAVSEALKRLGYTPVTNIDMAKLFTLSIDAENAQDAKVLAQDIAQKVLANPVIEHYVVLDMKEDC